MSRYIDADALKEKYTMVIKQYSGGIMERPAVLLETIDEAPHIDIVKCKECDMSEVYQSDSNGVMARYCKAFTPTRMIADDDYCSYGERRE